MFLPSQLADISKRFQVDVEDLQVLLQEEGLPVGSAECLQELASRLGSDPRFRRDVAFMVQSMIGRERAESGSVEPGSMDILGVLVVAAAGTQHIIEGASRQQVMRELLRFVIQQRAPATAPTLTAVAPIVQRRASARDTAPPPFEVAREFTPQVPTPAEPDLAAARSPLRLEREDSGRARVRWSIGALAVLIVVAAGLAIWRSDSGSISRERPRLSAAASQPLPAHPAASKPPPPAAEPLPAAVPHHSQPARQSRRRWTRPPARQTRYLEPAQPSLPIPMPASTPQKITEKPFQVQNSSKPDQSMTASTVQPARPHPESPSVSLPAGTTRQTGTPGSIDVNKVFAHPEAALAAADIQTPPPVFHPHDPVLIARNAPASAALKPQVQGTVHLGSTGTMAGHLMFSPEPEYPAQAIAAGLQGQVTVRAIVGPQGNVIDAHVVSGPPLLREAALDAVGRWRYRPYEEDGKPIAIATTAILDFEIPGRK